MESFVPVMAYHNRHIDESTSSNNPSSTAAKQPQPPGRQDVLLKRQRGSGIESLMKQIEGGDDVTSGGGLSVALKGVLTNLLQENEIPVSAPSRAWMHHYEPRKKRKPIETSMSDERVMQLAQEGELSFLASLLKVIEEEGGSITTKFLIKACCLAVEPARVPSHCDAKEMVMSALHFLSQPFEPASDNFPQLPLIQCIHEAPDLEKRSYEKYGDWTTRDSVLIDQVLQLEQVFYNSIDYKYLAREHMCPPLRSGRDLLLLKGSPPAFCMGKTKKPSLPRRKKTEGSSGPVVEDGAE